MVYALADAERRGNIVTAALAMQQRLIANSTQRRTQTKCLTSSNHPIHICTVQKLTAIGMRSRVCLSAVTVNKRLCVFEDPMLCFSSQNTPECI